MLFKKIQLIRELSIIFGRAVTTPRPYQNFVISLVAWFFGNRLEFKFRTIVNEVKEISDRFITMSGQLHTSSTSLAERATQESAALVQTTSSLEQISTMIAKNNEYSQELQKFQTQSQTSVSDSKRSAQQMMLAMTTLKQSNQKLENEIQSSNLVSDIVTGNTKKMNDILHENSNYLESGVESAQKCEDSLEKIVQESGVISKMVSEISAASNEQATGVREINNAMLMLDNLSQENTRASQELLASSSQLTQENASLDSSVKDIYKLVRGSSSQTTKAS